MNRTRVSDLPVMNYRWLARARQLAPRNGREIPRLTLVIGWRPVPGVTRTPEEIAALAAERYGPPVNPNADGKPQDVR